jgi:hypothetical protein
MSNPFVNVSMLASVAGAHSRDFAVGWGNGMARWHGRKLVSGELAIPLCGFALGTVKYAASEAAVTFMRELEG